MRESEDVIAHYLVILAHVLLDHVKRKTVTDRDSPSADRPFRFVRARLVLVKRKIGSRARGGGKSEILHDPPKGSSTSVEFGKFGFIRRFS